MRDFTKEGTFGIRVSMPVKFPRRLVAMKWLVVVAPLLLFTGAQPGGSPYVLECTTHKQYMLANENVQIRLTIKGITAVQLFRAFPGGENLRDDERSPEFQCHIGYVPKTPGLKKVGPFEVEFQGYRLKSDVIYIEVGEEWPWTEERYDFRAFPRKVPLGQPIRVWLIQQYTSSRGPFYDSRTTKSVSNKRWESGGLTGPGEWTRSTFYFDWPTTAVGKFSITKADLPSLPDDMAVELIEVEVIPAGSEPQNP